VTARVFHPYKTAGKTNTYNDKLYNSHFSPNFIKGDQTKKDERVGDCIMNRGDEKFIQNIL
jgi:hypothetical protein